MLIGTLEWYALIKPTYVSSSPIMKQDLARRCSGLFELDQQSHHERKTYYAMLQQSTSQGMKRDQSPKGRGQTNNYVFSGMQRDLPEAYLPLSRSGVRRCYLKQLAVLTRDMYFVKRCLYMYDPSRQAHLGSQIRLMIVIVVNSASSSLELSDKQWQPAQRGLGGWRWWRQAREHAAFPCRTIASKPSMYLYPYEQIYCRL